MVTIKRIDVASAMKIGALMYALNFTVFGLLWLAFQSVILNGFASAISSSATVNGQPVPTNLGSGFAVANLACCAGFYVVGVISAAIGGGIFGAVTAFFYNLIANWVGGLRVQTDSLEEKPKRETGFNVIE